MLKRFALVAIIGLICVVATGCRFGAPLLEDMGGYGKCGCNDCTKTKMIIRNWARDARHQERCIDNLFLNYDINDPYRGDYLPTDCWCGY